MFKSLTKRFAKGATDNAVEGMKESLNDKIDKYGDIIQFGLVLSVIIIGGRHIARKPGPPSYSQVNYPGYMGYSSGGYLPQPITINNYYDKGGRKSYGHYNKLAAGSNCKKR